MWHMRNGINVMEYFKHQSRNQSPQAFGPAVAHQFPRVFPGHLPLAKEPEDSGYETGATIACSLNL